MTLRERWEAKVEKGEGCWIWRGAMMGTGYGCIMTGSRRGPHYGPKAAHRVSWMLHYGEIPPGLYVCHRCDVPACVRPDHLFLGTPRDNVLDRERKGRHHKTHSGRGANHWTHRDITRHGRVRFKSAEERVEILRLSQLGLSNNALAKRYGCSWDAIARALRTASEPAPGAVRK